MNEKNASVSRRNFMSGMGIAAAAGLAIGGASDAFGLTSVMAEGDIADYVSIERLVVWERQARVRNMFDELAENVYWEDATITTSWKKGPVADWLAAGQGAAERADATADEVIVNRSDAPSVHLHGTRAYVELPVESNHWTWVNGERAVWTSYMRLFYSVEKRDGVWKIADMNSLYEMDKLAPVVPGTDLHIDPADLEGLRRSHLWMSYMRIAAGGEAPEGLVGLDTPEELQRVYDEAEAWIAEG